MSLFRLRSKASRAAEGLYLTVVAQGRQPAFFAQCGVPDTLDGRFEMIVLHAVLVIARLRQAGAEGSRVAQALFDALFADMDRNLREMGVGDLSVGRKVKAMAKGFYGRAEAYEAGLAAEDEALEQALARNVYGTLPGGPDPGRLAALASYVRRQADALAAQDPAALLAGSVKLDARLDAEGIAATGTDSR